MIKRITRILLLLQAGIAWALFLALRRFGYIENPWLAAALACTIVISVRMLIVANNFVLARRFCTPAPPGCGLSFLQACRLFGNEFIASMVSSSWTLAFRTFADRPAPQAHGLPVLLVHGYGCNSGYWHSMSRQLLKSGISHRGLDMEPIGASIDVYAPQIEDAITQLCRDSRSDRVIIVAHSMGGLAARAFFRAYGAQRVAALITLGTPHSGSGLANFAPGENSRQMCWHGGADEGKPSRWLAALAAQEGPLLRARFVSIYSHHDNIVSPQSSAHLEYARNIAFSGIGHVSLACHPAVQAQVIDEIRRISEDSCAQIDGAKLA